VGGYCYLNNAAIAAHHLSARGNVAILDLDYHHGNGTQDIFWDNPRVFFGSIHADPRREYPYYAGYADETGGAHAPFSNLNLPLPSGTSGPAYLVALNRLLDAAQRFAPVTLVISIGFDTFIDDPLCAFQLILQDYRSIGAAIAQLGLPTLLVQEGGYNVSADGALAEQLLRGLLDRA
jgi:acetoin utilization deacetylase AcuC-like enzyme